MYRHSDSKGQRGGGNTEYTHDGPLSKGQRGGRRPSTDTQDLFLKVRGEVGDSVPTVRPST